MIETRFDSDFLEGGIISSGISPDFDGPVALSRCRRMQMPEVPMKVTGTDLSGICNDRGAGRIGDSSVPAVRAWCGRDCAVCCDLG